VGTFCGWLVAHHSSCIELGAAVFGIVGVWLSIPESVWNWPLGMANVALSYVVLARQGLYANAGLQIVYFGLSVYGWYEWLHGGRARTALEISRTTRGTWERVATATLLIWVALMLLTRRMPGATQGFVDAGTTAVSLVAEWMLAKKLLENWTLWIVIDGAYVALLVFDKLYLLAINYAVYFVLAVAGYVAWKRTLERHSATLAVT
jgi:nicotinamide mononucleotide transporter